MEVKRNVTQVLFCRLAFAFFCMLPASLVASSEVKNKVVLVDALKLRSAESVTFYLRKTSNYVNTLKEPTENAFKQVSCIFKTNDPDNIASLVVMFGNSDPRKSTANYTTLKNHLKDEEVWNMKYGVYFTFADGSKIKYLFPPSTGVVNGYLIRSVEPLQRYPIEVHHALPWNLVYWASRLGKPEVLKNENLDVTVTDCMHEVITTVYQRHYNPKKDGGLD